MPNTQEICRVEITWLEKGEVCLNSALGLESMNHRSVTVFPHDLDESIEFAPEVRCVLKGEPPPRRCIIDKGELVGAMHAYTEYEDKDGPSIKMRPAFHISQEYNPSDPPVEMLVPAVIYTFHFPDEVQSWLAYLVDVDGLETVVKNSLNDLLNIGYYLWHRNQVTDLDRWGVTVSFYALWTIEVGGGEDPDVDWWLEGWVDPRKVSETKLPPQTKPERRATLAHRAFQF